jgi:hypothetical protein
LNLAGHVTECKGAKDAKKLNGPTSEEQVNLKQSVEIMNAFLKEGELNPEVIVTYKGFIRIFAASIFDESIPWTAGEAPTLVISWHTFPRSFMGKLFVNLQCAFFSKGFTRKYLILLSGSQI